MRVAAWMGVACSRSRASAAYMPYSAVHLSRCCIAFGVSVEAGMLAF
jgi:hypothetical protein